jgi:hypothetical protein
VTDIIRSSTVTTTTSSWVAGAVAESGQAMSKHRLATRECASATRWFSGAGNVGGHLRALR